MPNALVSDITSTNWQLSNQGYGIIVQNADDIQQCLQTIYTTQKGSDPLRPDFGIDLLAWIDIPTPLATPGLINEMILAAVYEPRIVISSITAKELPHKIIFALTWAYASTFNQQGTTSGNVPDQQISYFVLSTMDGFVLTALTGDNFIAKII